MPAVRAKYQIDKRLCAIFFGRCSKLKFSVTFTSKQYKLMDT
jgi:hypothetical protein